MIADYIVADSYLLARLRRDFADDFIAGLFILFDVDSEHEDHSEELPLFVGCIVNFIVSYLICMFQDSVPAGPFLSSVCISIDVKLVRANFNWKLLRCDVACVDSPQFLHARFSFGVIALQYSHGIFFKQGAHGYLDGMGQRRPIQVALRTHLQFLLRDAMWPTQEPPCRFSTRITAGFLN